MILGRRAWLPSGARTRLRIRSEEFPFGFHRGLPSTRRMPEPTRKRLYGKALEGIHGSYGVERTSGTCTAESERSLSFLRRRREKVHGVEIIPAAIRERAEGECRTERIHEYRILGGTSRRRCFRSGTAMREETKADVIVVDPAPEGL